MTAPDPARLQTADSLIRDERVFNVAPRPRRRARPYIVAALSSPTGIILTALIFALALLS